MKKQELAEVVFARYNYQIIRGRFQSLVKSRAQSILNSQFSWSLVISSFMIFLPRPVSRKCDFLRPLKFDLVTLGGKLYISVEGSMRHLVHKLATDDEFTKPSHSLVCLIETWII